MTDEPLAHRKHPVLPAKLSAPHFIIALGLLLLGAILIGYGALGDLWFDEILTLHLLEPVKSFGGIIWDIRHDNNHILNSMYLYVVGPYASPIIIRGLSIVFGIASIAAAGLALSRNTAVAALTAMLLFAVSYPIIHYASEARGYAGLVLFSLLSLILLQREFDRPRRINRYALAITLGLGVLAHLTMLLGAVAFGLWTLWVFWRRTSNLRQTIVSSFITLFPAICCAALVTIATLYSGLRYGFVISGLPVPDGFALGGLVPFEFARFMNGYAMLIGLLVGVPDSVPAWVCLGGTAILFTLAAYLWRNRDDPIFSLYVISIAILPAALLSAHVPNSGYVKYMIFCGTIFLLFVADIASFAWQKSGPLRAIAVVAVLAIVAGNARSLAHFYKDGRGHYSEAVAEMGKSGRIVYGVDHRYRTPMVINYYAKKLGIGVSFTDTNWCANPPDWWVIEVPNNPLLAYKLFDGTMPEGCVLRFSQASTYPTWGLSGRQWVLYRRVN
jgi:hypothetical protein